MRPRDNPALQRTGRAEPSLRFQRGSVPGRPLNADPLFGRGNALWKLYPYVGPAHLAKQANSETPRLHVEDAASLAAWVTKQPEIESDGTLTVTFVVLPDGL